MTGWKNMWIYRLLLRQVWQTPGQLSTFASQCSQIRAYAHVCEYDVGLHLKGFAFRLTRFQMAQGIFTCHISVFSASQHVARLAAASSVCVFSEFSTTYWLVTWSGLINLINTIVSGAVPCLDLVISFTFTKKEQCNTRPAVVCLCWVDCDSICLLSEEFNQKDDWEQLAQTCDSRVKC